MRDRGGTPSPPLPPGTKLLCMTGVTQGWGWETGSMERGWGGRDGRKEQELGGQEEVMHPGK